MVVLLLPLIGGFAPTGAQAQAGERCFPETGHCISGPIRAYWERNGGLPIFGYPISTQRVELVEGQPFPVQWFERDRLEDHGAQGVLAGRLGARVLELTYRPWEYFDKVSAADVPANCQFFAQTGHSLCQPYLGYWRANGGLERFGFPVTQPFYDNAGTDMYATQYFERRRMEIHPELPGSPILLGLLGSEVLNAPEQVMSYPDCLQQAPPSLLPAIAKLHLGEPIGCPAGASWVALPASTQQFQRGIMIWLSQRSTYPQSHGLPADDLRADRARPDRARLLRHMGGWPGPRHACVHAARAGALCAMARLRQGLEHLPRPARVDRLGHRAAGADAHGRHAAVQRRAAGARQRDRRGLRVRQRQ